MNESRRNFFKNASLAAISSPFLISTLNSCKSSSSETKKTEIIDDLSGKSINSFGLQLWTVKEEMAKDAKGTLKAIAEAGYNQIESFTGDQGVFWGMTPKDFTTFIGDLGMKMVSSHINSDFTVKKETEDEFKKLVDNAAIVGVKYLINPFPGENIKTSDEWKKITDGLNRQGEITKASGLKMAYHNHHIEFLPTQDGEIPEEIMLKGTNADLVDFELDLYWVVKAAQDPEKWLKDYTGRFKLCHIKDLYPVEKVKELIIKEGPEKGFWPIGASCVAGTGRIDFPKILKTAKQNGMDYYIVEQERFDNSTQLQDIKLDGDYMKAFKFA